MTKWDYLIEGIDDDIRDAEREWLSYPSEASYNKLMALYRRAGRSNRTKVVQKLKKEWEALQDRDWEDAAGRYTINRQNVESLSLGQWVYHLTEKMRGGSPFRARINGRVKLWKTRPDEFRVPIKIGFRGPGDYITHLNGNEWTTLEP